MNSISVQEMLVRARSEGGRLPAAEASALFAAAVRLAAEQGAVPRPHQLRLDDAGALSVSVDEAGPLFPEYLAPELSGEDPPRRAEPRVQVYAAGALGYELLTAQVPPVPPGLPGAELSGPLADLVRLALTPDRRERFGDLQQLLDAVEVVQPRLAEEEERQLLSGLLRKQQRREGPPALPDAPAEALRELSARVDGLEASLLGMRTQHDAVLKRLAEAARQVSERQKVEAGHEPLAEWEAEARQRAQRLPLGRVFAVAAGAALLVVGLACGVAFALLRDSLWPAPRAVAAASAPAPPALAAPPDAAAVPLPALPAAGAGATAAQVTAPEPAPAAAPPGEADAAHALAAASGPAAPAPPAASATGAAAGAGAAPPAAAQPAPDGAAPRVRDDRVSSHQIVLAVARSQVSRGDKSLEAGHASEAIASFRTALENLPDLPEAVRGLGMAHAMLGKDKEARQEYERYLKLAPQAEDAADIRKAIVELKARQRIAGDDK